MAAEDAQDKARVRRGSSESVAADALPEKVQAECSKFVARLRRQQVPNALDIARKTLEIMRLVVATSGAKDLGALIKVIKQAGQVLVSAQPHELVIGNMVRRVLYIVREETAAPEGGAAQSSSATSGGRSLHRILEAPPDAPDYSQQPAKVLKAPILEVLNEVIEELSSVSAAIAEQATEGAHTPCIGTRRARGVHARSCVSKLHSLVHSAAHCTARCTAHQVPARAGAGRAPPNVPLSTRCRRSSTSTRTR